MGRRRKKDGGYEFLRFISLLGRVHMTTTVQKNMMSSIICVRTSIARNMARTLRMLLMMNMRIRISISDK